jgi:hypothetical protein
MDPLQLPEARVAAMIAEIIGYFQQERKQYRFSLKRVFR